MADRWPKCHDLKCAPHHFDAVKIGIKTFELQLSDRDYRLGDQVRFREWLPDDGYSGAYIVKKIVYIIEDHHGQVSGYCCIGFAEQ